MDKPKVTVIIPVYNAEKYIKLCFDSIINQTFSNFEVIIINDGSTDNSLEICNEYYKSDKRFKIYNFKNQGAAKARNAALDLATGEYIFFVDADDWLEKEALSNHIKEIKDVDLVIGCSHNCYFKDDKLLYKKREYFYKEGKYLNKNNVREMYIDIATNGVSHAPHNKMYKKRLIDKYHIRFPDRRKYEDLAFNNQYIDKVNSLSIINSYDYNYRVSNLKGVALKLPDNMFEIFTDVNNELITLLKSWNVYDYKSEKMLKSKYITEVASCINNTYNPNLDYNFKKRYHYIKSIINTDKVQEACKYVDSSKFVNIISKLIKHKAIVMIDIFYKVKIVFKNIIKTIYIEYR